jgi:hypothetical protein
VKQGKNFYVYPASGQREQKPTLSTEQEASQGEQTLYEEN